MSLCRRDCRLTMQSDVILDAKDAGVLAGLEQREGVHLRGLAHVRPVDPENPVPNFQRAIPAWKERERREKPLDHLSE